MDKNGPTNYQNVPKTDQQIIKNYQQITKKNTSNLPKIYKNRQNLTDVRADDRADVLNKMLFIKCNVFITKTELIHL